MGNRASYIQLPPMAGGGGCVQVVHADGRVTRVAGARAAEVMADHPGQFLCEAARLAVGCRVPGVGADEVLSPRAEYFLLPLDMLYSVLTDDEMAALSAAAASHGGASPSPWKRIVITRGRRGHGRRRRRHQRTGDNGDADGRVFPVVGLMEQIQADHDGGDQAARVVVKPGGGGGGGGLIRRHHRAWRPALDTIDEAP